LGERVQRILQEAWEGAYNLRQEAEREVTDLREQTQQDVEAMRVQARSDVEELREVASREAAEVVDEATRRALHIRDETERRRQAYLERVERDREQAIGQITYLYDQRQGAIAELARLQATVQATIEEMVRSPLGRPAPGVMEATVDGARAARAASVRAHAAGTSSGSIAGVGPGGSGGTGAPIAEGAAGDNLGAEHTFAERPAAPGFQSAPLPGILGPLPGDPADAGAGGGVPTGPMERFVRPSDRDAARAATRPADAEANAMERVMRKGGSTVDPGPGADLSAGAGHAGSFGPAEPVTEAPGDPAPRGRSGVSGAAKASAVLGGLIRPRRQAPPQGVYDAEQDGLS
jgi:vacuolar-type H+-ATPase subunit H